MNAKLEKIKNVGGKILKGFYKVLFVIVVVYFGSQAVIELITYRIPNLIKNKEKENKVLKNTINTAIKVSIGDINDIYNENVIKADEMLKERYLKITGYVEEIRSITFWDDRVEYYLIIKDSLELEEEERKYSAYIHFKNDESLKLRELITGQEVTVIGLIKDNDFILNIKDAIFEVTFDKYNLDNHDLIII